MSLSHFSLSLSLSLSLISLSSFRRKESNKETLTGDRKESKSYPLLTQKQPVREPGNRILLNQEMHAYIHTYILLLLLLLLYYVNI